MSSGGDEVNLACWEEDEETSEELRAKNQTIAEALNVFVEEVQGELKENGKTPFIKSGKPETMFGRWIGMIMAGNRYDTDT